MSKPSTIWLAIWRGRHGWEKGDGWSYHTETYQQQLVVYQVPVDIAKI